MHRPSEGNYDYFEQTVTLGRDQRAGSTDAAAEYKRFAYFSSSYSRFLTPKNTEVPPAKTLKSRR